MVIVYACYMINMKWNALDQFRCIENVINSNKEGVLQLSDLKYDYKDEEQGKIIKQNKSVIPLKLMTIDDLLMWLYKKQTQSQQTESILIKIFI